MQGRTRYEQVMRGAAPDVLPRCPILMQFAAEYIGSHYGAFAADHRVLVEANLRCAADFGFDQVSAISDPYRETQGFGAHIVFPRDAGPRCVAPPLAENRHLARLPTPDPDTSVRMRDRLDAVVAMHAAVGGRLSVLGWVEGPAAEAADLRGIQNFLLDLLDDEPYAEALMDRCTQTAIAFARAQLAAGADTIGMGDAIASQVSPVLYARLIAPREQQIIAAVHAAGGWVKLHICGDITRHLPAIAGVGADAVDLDHMVDLRTARQALGPDTVLLGNLDPVRVLLRGTPDDIRQGVRACYAAAGPPYMVNAGCEIPSGTPIANLQALCEEVGAGEA